MKVDFNNVRRQAVFSYERLVKILNAGLLKESVYGDSKNGKKLMDREGDVLLDSEQVENVMNELRSLIGTIAMCYEEGSEDYKNIYEEIYPVLKGERMPSFNDEDKL